MTKHNKPGNSGSHRPKGGRWQVDPPSYKEGRAKGLNPAPVNYPTWRRARRTSKQVKGSKVLHSRSGCSTGLIVVFALAVLIGLLVAAVLAAD